MHVEMLVQGRFFFVLLAIILMLSCLVFCVLCLLCIIYDLANIERMLTS
jgi:hypothetical protein